jgi:hypothetical protein
MKNPLLKSENSEYLKKESGNVLKCLKTLKIFQTVGLIGFPKEYAKLFLLSAGPLALSDESLLGQKVGNKTLLNHLGIKKKSIVGSFIHLTGLPMDAEKESSGRLTKSQLTRRAGEMMEEHKLWEKLEYESRSERVGLGTLEKIIQGNRSILGCLLVCDWHGVFFVGSSELKQSCLENEMAYMALVKVGSLNVKEGLMHYRRHLIRMFCILSSVEDPDRCSDSVEPA